MHDTILNNAYVLKYTLLILNSLFVATMVTAIRLLSAIINPAHITRIHKYFGTSKYMHYIVLNISYLIVTEFKLYDNNGMIKFLNKRM